MAASDAEKKVVEELPAEKDCDAAEDVGRVLTAPPGWTKKLMPKKAGTRHRNDIVFISPDGQEVKSKRQLDAFLRSHPGNPASSEFDWGTGETPRRSTRIHEKAKATENPEGEKSRKRERKASSKKTENEKKVVDSVTEASAAQDDAKVDAEEAKVEAEDATVEDTDAVDEKSKAAEEVEEKFKEEVVSSETAIKDGAENIEEKAEELEESNKADPADTELLPPAIDSSVKEMKDSEVPEDGIPQNTDAAVPQDAPTNPDGGPHQPKTSPYNC